LAMMVARASPKSRRSVSRPGRGSSRTALSICARCGRGVRGGRVWTMRPGPTTPKDHGQAVIHPLPDEHALRCQNVSATAADHWHRVRVEAKSAPRARHRCTTRAGRDSWCSADEPSHLAALRRIAGHLLNIDRKYSWFFPLFWYGRSPEHGGTETTFAVTKTQITTDALNTGARNCEYFR